MSAQILFKLMDKKIVWMLGIKVHLSGPMSINNFLVLYSPAYQKKYFSYFSTKTYVVGTQKNRLNEKFLLST